MRQNICDLGILGLKKLTVGKALHGRVINCVINCDPGPDSASVNSLYSKIRLRY
jgi:hypothetical protein